MPVWIQNLRMAIQNKPVVILHGNVRDCYIDENGVVHQTLTSLLQSVCTQVGGSFEEMRIFDPRGVEKIIPLGQNSKTSLLPGSQPNPTPSSNDSTEPPSPDSGPAEQDDGRTRQQPPTRILARWARKDLVEPTVNRIGVVYYLDKISPYKTNYGDEENRILYWLENVMENIQPNHRLIMVALQDSMIPLELYTQSPKCRVLPLPRPAKPDRVRYLQHRMPDHPQHNTISDLSDGLYLMELETIIRQIQDSEKQDISSVRGIVNRFRIGEKEDHWEALTTNDLQNAQKFFIEDENVIGQPQAVNKVINVLYRAKAGLAGMASGSTSKPKGVLFFTGPPGVGKTLLAKKLAKFLFGREEAFIRVDMSELKDEHSTSKLIGSPPGFVGYEEGGALTNKVLERPFAVVLFDEIEKAHPKVLDVFLQLLDEGRLTDSRGQTVFFTETVVVFTSNIGNRAKEQEQLEKILTTAEFNADQKRERVQRHFKSAVRGYFNTELSRPELLRRIGNNIVPFNHIDSEDTQKRILVAHLKRIKTEFDDQHSDKAYKLDLNETNIPVIVNYFHTHDHDGEMASFGGGGITNIIDDLLMTPLSKAKLDADHYHLDGSQFQVSISGDELKVTNSLVPTD